MALENLKNSGNFLFLNQNGENVQKKGRASVSFIDINIFFIATVKKTLLSDELQHTHAHARYKKVVQDFKNSCIH